MTNKKKTICFISLFIGFSILTSCHLIPRRHKRTREERTKEAVKDFKKESIRIKGKDEPGKLF